MNIDKDPELDTFFQELQKQDEHLSIPPFPELERKSRTKWWIPVGIAASILIGFFLFQFEETPPPPSPEVLIITLEEGPDQELQFRIHETTEMDIWESPTASLLTEF